MSNNAHTCNFHEGWGFSHHINRNNMDLCQTILSYTILTAYVPLYLSIGRNHALNNEVCITVSGPCPVLIEWVLKTGSGPAATSEFALICEYATSNMLSVAAVIICQSFSVVEYFCLFIDYQLPFDDVVIKCTKTLWMFDQNVQYHATENLSRNPEYPNTCSCRLTCTC